MMKTRRRVVLWFFLQVTGIAACLFVTGSPVNAITIGPGSGSVLSLDPIGWLENTTSLEVCRVSKPLAAGTYSVGSFSFHNATLIPAAGVQAVVPFLAVLTNPGNPEDPLPNFELQRSYQTLWVGSAV